MKKLKNIFINDQTKTEQFIFVVDGKKYHRFNGNYALYEQGIINEKREYALRFGESAEYYQVFGVFTGHCPKCSSEMTNVPIIKICRKMACFCPECETNSEPLENGIDSLVNVLDIHQNRPDVFEYEEISLPEELEADND
jgi:hypothetical protein